MASRSINQVTLLGNLTRDPELKYTPAGTAVCTFGVATNRSWTTADGQSKEDVQYHNIVAWQKLAELCGKLLGKGKKVYLTGRITYREYTDKTGQQRYRTEIVMDDFILLSDGRKLDAGSAESHPSTPSETGSQKMAHIYDDEQKHESAQATGDVNPDDIPF